MLHTEDPKIKKLLFTGNFGLEKEGLRITRDGFLSQTPHPFPGNDHIVRDFCENQTEINTGISDSAEGAVKELEEHTLEIQKTLSSLPEPEYLWPFSNPPYIRREEDIPIARFEGAQSSKTAYREFLSDRYGRYKMTLSGIHVNFSFSDELLKADFELSDYSDFRTYKNALYLHAAEQAAAYSWLLVAVTAASPLMDGSYVEKRAFDRDEFSGMASVRCSELGYWNAFPPVFDYSDIEKYTASMKVYFDDGWLKTPSELYYPVRLKRLPGGDYFEALNTKGVDHIELRMFDLNPLTKEGIDVRDVKFAHLMLIWFAAMKRKTLKTKDQIQAMQNYKNAAHYDLKTVKIYTPDDEVYTVHDAALKVIGFMKDFYKNITHDYDDILDFEEQKFIDCENRYAWQIRNKYSGSFVRKGLILAKKWQDEYLGK